LSSSVSNRNNWYIGVESQHRRVAEIRRRMNHYQTTVRDFWYRLDERASNSPLADIQLTFGVGGTTLHDSDIELKKKEPTTISNGVKKPENWTARFFHTDIIGPQVNKFKETPECRTKVLLTKRFGPYTSEWLQCIETYGLEWHTPRTLFVLFDCLLAPYVPEGDSTQISSCHTQCTHGIKVPHFEGTMYPLAVVSYWPEPWPNMAKTLNGTHFGSWLPSISGQPDKGRSCSCFGNEQVGLSASSPRQPASLSRARGRAGLFVHARYDVPSTVS